MRLTKMGSLSLVAVACAILGAAYSSIQVGQPASAQTARPATLFQGARVIVGDGSAPIENAAFLVEGNRITSVGRAGAGSGSGWRGPRRPHRQDGHAGVRRSPQPHRVRRHGAWYRGREVLHARERHRPSRTLRLHRPCADTQSRQRQSGAVRRAVRRRPGEVRRSPRRVPAGFLHRCSLPHDRTGVGVGRYWQPAKQHAVSDLPAVAGETGHSGAARAGDQVCQALAGRPGRIPDSRREGPVRPFSGELQGGHRRGPQAGHEDDRPRENACRHEGHDPRRTRRPDPPDPGRSR